jgi:hypothetical protein
LTIPSGTSIEALEVAMRDLSLNPEIQKNERENTILQDLLNLISYQRRTQRLSKAEILIIDTGSSVNVSKIPTNHRR